VIELYEQGKSSREIAKEVHMSFGDIASVIRRHSGEGKAETKKEEVVLSKGTQVFKLFEQHKSPIDVTIELDLRSDDVGKLYKEWWQLKGLDQLNQLYDEIGDDIFKFHRTYKYIKDQGFTHHQLLDAANHLDELQSLRSEREQLTQDIQNLALQKDQLDESTTFARMDLNSINLDIDVQKKEFERLSNEKRKYESLIASVNSNAGCQRIRSIAEATATSILRDNKEVLVVALRALLQALKEEPRNELQMLIYGSLNYPMYEPRNGNMPRNSLQLRQAVILQAAEEMYTNLLAKCVNNVMWQMLL
jgi:chromosome segregation ATPase